MVKKKYDDNYKAKGEPDPAAHLKNPSATPHIGRVLKFERTLWVCAHARAHRTCAPWHSRLGAQGRGGPPESVKLARATCSPAPSLRVAGRPVRACVRRRRGASTRTR